MKTSLVGTWHHYKANEIFRLLEVDASVGLSEQAVRERREEFGWNRLTARKRRSEWLRFLLQFHAPLVYILLLATVVTALLGAWVDASVIFGVVLINAIVGFVQEFKAERSIEALAQTVSTTATVRRDGQKRQVPAQELVPGDIVLLQSGDKVPADLRLFHVKDLKIDESMLTGESKAASKHSAAMSHETVLADRKNQAFAGTLVTYGQAEGVVWSVGDATEVGRVSRLIHEAIDLDTPLTKKLARLSRLLLLVIMGLTAVAFFVGIKHGKPVSEVFISAVALAVGAVPEGLPAAVTITLAIGVTRMAGRRVIVRRLPAVESLGATTVICSDKTGTLTENQMTVGRVWAGGVVYEVTGTGYEPLGKIVHEGAPVDLGGNIALQECLRAGLLCNDSRLVREGARHVAQGDPTEVALIVSAQKAGLVSDHEDASHPRLDVIPFESQHQYMATLHQRPGEGDKVVFKKGAVERLVDRCSTAVAPDGAERPIDKDSIHAAAHAMAASGLRVLAFARLSVGGGCDKISPPDVAAGLSFLGLQGMVDPPRVEAIAAVKNCKRAGILVKMITGDHAGTARAVAEQLGLGNGVNGEASEIVVISGHELSAMDEGQIAEAALRASVFARVSPEEKLRLVRGLQARGHVVAMTGDGVNDAPALKQADIGIAMGLTGTDVAKGAADMILTDDNFASIEAAVEEGRGVYDNLTKFIVWTLPTNMGEAAVLLMAIVTGTALPLLPVQALWINMMTSILLGTALVFEPREKDLMLRPPRDPAMPILTFPLVMRTGLVTLLILLGAFGLFYFEQRLFGASLAEARTIVVNVIVVLEVFYLLNCRSLTHSMFSVGLFSNPWIIVGAGLMIAAQLALTYMPVLNKLFHTAPIGAQAWLHILSVGLAAGLIVGFEKWVRFGVLKRGAVEAAT